MKPPTTLYTRLHRLKWIDVSSGQRGKPMLKIRNKGQLTRQLHCFSTRAFVWVSSLYYDTRFAAMKISKIPFMLSSYFLQYHRKPLRLYKSAPTHTHTHAAFNIRPMLHGASHDEEMPTVYSVLTNQWNIGGRRRRIALRVVTGSPKRRCIVVTGSCPRLAQSCCIIRQKRS